MDVIIDRGEGPAEAQQLAARLLSTPVPYHPGPIHGEEPGQVCYHRSGFNSEHEIYVRNNVVVAVHCEGPTPLPKSGDARNYKAEKKSIAGDCTQLTQDLALRIDRMRQLELGKWPVTEAR